MALRVASRSAIAAIALVVSCIPVPAQQRAFTLEQVMSSPFPSELTAAPKGGAVAWVFNARGARNIWVAEGPDHKARQITSYNEDDGQDLGQLSWVPNGQALVYTRGGDFEWRRAAPNPRSFPQGVEQGVWLIPISGGTPRKIAEGNTAAVSPQGDRVAFLNKDQIWLAKLDGSEKAAQLVHSNGSVRDLKWAPDGSRLAFVSSRGDHSFVGVYDFGEKAVRYVDPGVDRDVEPAWSPDSRRIAFIRIPFSAKATVFGPHRAGYPWSIRIADVASGEGRQVWTASQGDGSVFYPVETDRQLLWGANDQLVFPWERSGWLHLYSVSSSGGTPAELTPGEFEVDHVSLSPDRKEIVYSSNQDDIDRRHIWKVALAGGSPDQITRGTGIEWTPVTTADGTATALLRSDAKWPARPAIIVGSQAMRDIAPGTLPADFAGDAMIAPQAVIISAADGMLIHCQLFLPSGAQQPRHPAIVFFHGGSRRQMLLGWHYREYYHHAYAMNQFLACRGYIVLSVNYRSGIGYGMKFREALNYGAAGASEFNDVQGAGVYLRGRPDVDPNRIGVWGGSYGGYLTALALARASNLFAAGVDFHGVHDWNQEIPTFLPSYHPEADPNAARLAWESSPLASVKTWRSPVLLIQGDDDRNVPFAETVHLTEALRQQGVEYRLLVFPDEIHDFLLHLNWLAAYRASADFLEQHLKR